MSNPAPEYVAARRVLLDALAALEGHLDNLILVGAQAVYHHTGEASLNVPLMTTDADLVINAVDLAGAPEIGGALVDAGFTPGQNPGHWVAISRVTVDLMVVPHQAGISKATARAARLPPHDVHTARITRGLEPALLDNDRVTIDALEPKDERTFELRIAGPAALLTAKAIKISERLDRIATRPDRINEKDALDAFRILQAIDTPELARAFGTHLRDRYAAIVTAEALDMYRVHGSTPHGRLVVMAANAAPDDPTVAPAFVALVNEVLAAL